MRRRCHQPLHGARSLLLPHGNPHRFRPRPVCHTPRCPTVRLRTVTTSDTPLAQRLTGHLDHDAAHGGHQGHPVTPVARRAPAQPRPHVNGVPSPGRTASPSPGTGQIHGARLQAVQTSVLARVASAGPMVSPLKTGRAATQTSCSTYALTLALTRLYGPAVDHDLQRHRDVAPAWARPAPLRSGPGPQAPTGARRSASSFSSAPSGTAAWRRYHRVTAASSCSLAIT